MTATTPSCLPAGAYVSDGGLETDLIFNRGLDLPGFASFPLVEQDHGREVLRAYYDGYAAIARSAGAGLTLESPTWRANARLGVADRLRRRATRRRQPPRDRAPPGAPRVPTVTSTTYGSSAPSARAATGTSRARSPTPTRPPSTTARRWRRSPTRVPTSSRRTPSPARRRASASRAARAAGVPVLVGFTVETDGRLPDGTALREAVAVSMPRRRPTGSSSTAPTPPTSPPPWTAAGGSAASSRSTRTPPPRATPSSTRPRISTPVTSGC